MSGGKIATITSLCILFALCLVGFITYYLVFKRKRKTSDNIPVESNPPDTPQGDDHELVDTKNNKENDVYDMSPITTNNEENHADHEMEVQVQTQDN